MPEAEVITNNNNKKKPGIDRSKDKEKLEEYGCKEEMAIAA